MTTKQRKEVNRKNSQSEEQHNNAMNKSVLPKRKTKFNTNRTNSKVGVDATDSAAQGDEVKSSNDTKKVLADPKFAKVRISDLQKKSAKELHADAELLCIENIRIAYYSGAYFRDV